MQNLLISSAKGNSRHASFTVYEIPLIDHRFVYLDDHKNPTFTCPIALGTTLRWLRNVDPNLMSPRDYRDVAEKLKGNRSVQGFILEGRVVSCIREKGAGPINTELKSPITMKVFAGDVPEIDYSLGATLYVPEQCSFPGIDAMIVNNYPDTSSGVKTLKTTYYPIQITLQRRKDHSDSVGAFIETYGEWKKDLPQGRQAFLSFVWVTPFDKFAEKMSRRRPPYTALRFNFGDFDQCFAQFDEKLSLSGLLEPACFAFPASLFIIASFNFYI